MSIRGFRSLTAALPGVVLLLPATIAGQQKTANSGWPCNGTVDPAYIRSAEATGGAVLLFDPSELAGAAAEMRASDRHDDVVFRAGGNLTRGESEFQIPVDSTIDSIYFFVSVQCVRSVTVVRPTGDPLRTDEPGVEYHGFRAIRLFTVPQPAPGPWTVKIVGRGFFSVVVKAATSVSLRRVTFSAGGLPVKGQRQRLEVRMNGAVSEVAFHAISPNGAAIAPLQLQLDEHDDDSRTFAGEVMLPAGDFRVVMTAIDAQGFRLQRADARLSVE